MCVSYSNNNTQTIQPVSQREQTERDVNPAREIRMRTYSPNLQLTLNLQYKYYLNNNLLYRGSDKVLTVAVYLK